MFWKGLVHKQRTVLRVLLGAATLPILCPAVANGDPWVPIYVEDFSTDPGWTTDDPLKLRWDPTTETFHGVQVNVEGTIAYTIVNGFDPQQTWRLEFDSRINDCGWSAGWDFGLYDHRLLYPYGAEVHQGIADGGRGTNHNSPFVNPGATFYPPWEFNTWYRHVLMYDAQSGVLSLTVTVRDNGVLFIERSLVTPPLPGDLTWLGVTRLHMKGGHSGVDPWASVNYNLDNIVLFQIPEPSSLALVGAIAAGLTARRRFR